MNNLSRLAKLGVPGNVEVSGPRLPGQNFLHLGGVSSRRISGARIGGLCTAVAFALVAAFAALAAHAADTDGAADLESAKSECIAQVEEEVNPYEDLGPVVGFSTRVERDMALWEAQTEAYIACMKRRGLSVTPDEAARETAKIMPRAL